MFGTTVTEKTLQLKNGTLNLSTQQWSGILCLPEDKKELGTITYNPEENTITILTNEGDTHVFSPKRKPGRPKKNQVSTAATTNTNSEAPAPKKRRGRPRKDTAETANKKKKKNTATKNIIPALEVLTNETQQSISKWTIDEFFARVPNVRPHMRKLCMEVAHILDKKVDDIRIKDVFDMFISGSFTSQTKYTHLRKKPIIGPASIHCWKKIFEGFTQ